MIIVSKQKKSFIKLKSELKFKTICRKINGFLFANSLFWCDLFFFIEFVVRISSNTCYGKIKTPGL